VMRAEMRKLAARHPSIKAHRNIGLFGMVDTHLGGYNQGHPAMGEFNKFLLANGLFTVLHWGSFMTNPPLCITEAQLVEGFAILDRGLPILDRAVQENR
jgi:taurine---2-oxoglutarate transaminase